MKALSRCIGLVQQSCTADRDTNLAESIAGITCAVAQGAELILLQELHTSLYFCQKEDLRLFDLAEKISGPTINQLSKIAKQLKVVIVASIFEERAAGLYHNTAVVIEKNGEIAGIYRKMHIPDDPQFYEKFYFTPGDLGFTPIKTSLGKLGILICWDQWYPEAARLMALAGADYLLYPTAIGWLSTETDIAEKKRQQEAWITIQRGHAIANGLPVIVANRVGFEATDNGTTQGLTFWGNSFICGPQGEILAKANEHKPEVVIAEVNLKRTTLVRRAWPYLRDRRIEAYEGISKRYLDG